MTFSPRARAASLWLAILVAMWIPMVWCCAHEPVLHDGWGPYWWHREVGLSLGSLWGFAKGSYLHNNPRLGQIITWLLFTPGPWHLIITPLVEIGVVLLSTTLALGRWPSWRRSDDAILFAAVAAMIYLVTPEVGPMFFYRPFSGNYLYGFSFYLILYLPYRFAAVRDVKHGVLFAIVVGIWAIFTGLTNEHTGPASILAITATLYFLRGRTRPWMWTGLVGLLLGYALLFFAPGQHERYNNLAEQAGPLTLIANRGVLGNLRIMGPLLLTSLQFLPWLAPMVIARRKPAADRADGPVTLVFFVAGLLMTLALLASPKLGGRLYFSTVVMWTIAVAMLVRPMLALTWVRNGVLAMSTAVIIFFGVHFIVTYRTVDAEFTARLAMLQSAPPGSAVVVPAYSTRHSRWFLGDDFFSQDLCNRVAAKFHLTSLTREPKSKP